MDLEGRILYEDNHLIAVNKLPSEIVQGDKTEDVPLSEDIKLYLKKKYNKLGNVYLAVIHRVDRPVSGVVFFAKTSKAAARMSEMIRNGELHKTYHAVTYSKPEPAEGKLVNYLFRDEKRNKSYIVPEDKIDGRKDIQRAELNYRCLASSERYHLVEVELITGRHHQIRVQLSSMGCVIKGDLKYGAPRSNPDGSISLHARKVEFVHPVTKQPVCVVAPYPSADKIWSFFNNVND